MVALGWLLLPALSDHALSRILLRTPIAYRDNTQRPEALTPNGIHKPESTYKSEIILEAKGSSPIISERIHGSYIWQTD